MPAFQREDAALKVTKALPNGAATIYTDGIDLGHGANGDFLADCELLVEAPALVVGDLPNGETMKYSLQHDTASDFSGATSVEDDFIIQTGAGGVGDVAASKRIRLPVDVKRYIRVKAVNSGTGDASDKSVTARLLM